jgi:hypothetical protein
MDLCDEKHRNERNDIEITVIKHRESFESEIAALEENIKEVGGWGDLYAYRLVIDKVVEYARLIEAYEEEMQ